HNLEVEKEDDEEIQDDEMAPTCSDEIIDRYSGDEKLTEPIDALLDDYRMPKSYFSKASTADLVAMMMRINGQHGGHNFLHLGDVREAMGIGKSEFENLILQARRQGLVSLSDAEGRNRLSDRDRDAVIRQGNEVLLYASLRKCQEVVDLVMK